jgi:two-component system OmpR family response regulator
MAETNNQTAAGKTILLAEDDPFISRMYAVKLGGAGFTVITKTNGREAYEAIKAEKPSLVMLDINMPELTGLEVLAALASDGFDFTATPTIILTNSSSVEDRKRAQQFGADYLVKAEMTPRQVLDCIDAKLHISDAGA